ncbi:hypothetical protein [Streptomyces justiciae]|uniref:hypothetical protein n=1 Tax=Streptomyces justiciae TaxID=2780140 RepID=UPI00211765E1|nr:hypothetical protein [Streptomyces justiciae]MCW8382695.1 hypothetical protein [Streptomyces justiciae]
MASNRKVRRRRPVLVAAVVVTVVACGTGWMISARQGTSGTGVSVSTETPAKRDEMIRGLRDLLTEHGQQVPDTSDMSTQEIEERWVRARVKYSEPAEMPVVYACDGIKAVFTPDCW